MNFYSNTVSPEMMGLLKRMMEISALSAFRLVGGTGLALQLGHRTSVDIDLFAAGGSPTPEEIGQILTFNFSNELSIVRFQRFGLTATIQSIKVDIYDWKVPFAEPVVEVEGIRMASIKDIFAFKCEALLGRRAEKDFVDIAEIAQHYSFADLFEVFHARYPQYSKAAIISILLKTSIFERDFTIQYSVGKSWENYVTLMMEGLKQYELNIQKEKEKKLDDREKKVQALIEKKRKKDNL